MMEPSELLPSEVPLSEVEPSLLPLSEVEPSLLPLSLLLPSEVPPSVVLASLWISPSLVASSSSQAANVNAAAKKESRRKCLFIDHLSIPIWG